MKKICLYILSLITIVFIIPVLFTQVHIETISMNDLKKIDLDQSKQNTTMNNVEHDYGNYNTIKVLHTKTGEIEELELDKYLYGVVSAEMPVNFEKEALKAQAIVARTYTIYKIMQNEAKHGIAQICDDSSCCQAWISKDDRLARWEKNEQEKNWNKITEAVEETKGKIIMYEGKPINAFFHSNSGGATEPPVNVWGGSGYPYLQTVETSGEESYEQYNSELEISKDDFVLKLKQKYSDFNIDFNQENCIQIIEYTSGGRIKTIKMGNYNFSGVEVRTIFGLKSANFSVEINDSIKFKVIGYGHGVGMSQTGADSLAKQGYDCYEIIKHFYTGVEINN